MTLTTTSTYSQPVTMNSQDNAGDASAQAQADALAQNMQGLTTTGFTTLPLSLQPKDPDSIKYDGPRPGQPGFVYVSSIILYSPFALSFGLQFRSFSSNSFPGSYLLIYITNNYPVQPAIRTQARWMYSAEDLNRLAGLPTFPETPGKIARIDVTDIKRPSLIKYHGRFPRVLLKELKYPMLACQIQEMNWTFPVGRPKTEEVFDQMVDEIWKYFDTHVVINSGVNTPYPLCYSEFYVQGLVQRVKNEASV